MEPLFEHFPAPPDWRFDWEALYRAYPWVREMEGCPQDPDLHAEGDVLTHTRMVCEETTRLTAWRDADDRRKAVLLAEVDESPGRAIRRLAELDDPRDGARALRGHEHEADYQAARRIARALARVDLYLFSNLDPDLIERIGIIPLDEPRDAQRLIQQCDSCILLHPAEWMRGTIAQPAGTP